MRVGGGEDVTVMCEVSGGKCDVVWSVAGEVIASSQWTNSSSNGESVLFHLFRIVLAWGSATCMATCAVAGA